MPGLTREGCVEVLSAARLLDFEMARAIGITSHHFLVGSRLVAKSLETVGEMLHDVGEVIGEGMGAGEKETFLPTLAKELSRELGELNGALHRTVESFQNVSLEGANGALASLQDEISGFHARGPQNGPHHGNAARGYESSKDLLGRRADDPEVKTANRGIARKGLSWRTSG